MVEKKSLLWTVAALCIMLHLDAGAQRMYRCGSAYQDRPCEGKQEGKVLRDFSGSAPVANAQSKDAQCSQRGAEAMKIVWRRESGAMREQQISALEGQPIQGLSHGESVALIESVYQKRGSAPEVRAAIEAECVAEKERLVQAAALAAAAEKLRAGGAAPASPPGSAPGSRGPSEADISRFEARRQEEIAENQEAFKKTRCADLARQYENLRRQERAGGSSATMARLNEQRRALDERQRGEGC